MIFELGPLKLHSYGFMLAVAFLVGIWLASREAKRLGENPDDVQNLAFWILLSSIVGSRLFHVIVFWDQMDSIWEPFKIWEGGLVYYGGFLGAVLASIIYTRLKKMDFWQFSDILAPSVALGLMFGRIGCTLVGCCYGKPCGPDFPLGITFPPETIGVAGVPLYPTQPAEAIGSLAIFLFLWLFLRYRRKFRGQVLSVFVLLYSLLRTVLEFWRADPRGFLQIFSITGEPGLTAQTAGGLMGGLLWTETLTEVGAGVYAVQLSESQVVSIALSLAVAVFWVYKSRRDKRLGVELGPVPTEKAKPNKRKGKK